MYYACILLETLLTKYAQDEKDNWDDFIDTYFLVAHSVIRQPPLRKFFSIRLICLLNQI